jgi:hypothetical protein
MTVTGTGAPRVRVPTTTDQPSPAWAREWHEASLVERAEAARAPRPPSQWIAAGFGLGVAASLAALLPALFPLSPGYSSNDTAAQIIAAVIATIVAVAVVPLASSVAARAAVGPGAGLGSLFLFAVALLSAGAAAIHFAVAKSHFGEYTPYGVFFLLSGAAQLAWPLLVLFRPVRPLLVIGAVGNLLIAALWAVDRIWGLPIGPEHWKPEAVGFADAAASAFELLLTVGCLALLAPSLHAQAHARRPGRVGLLLTAAVGVPTVLGLLSAIGVASTVLTPSA